MLALFLLIGALWMALGFYAMNREAKRTVARIHVIK